MADDLLLAYLADVDEPCPRCGYNLRGLRSPRCPECGDALRLRVGLTEPRLAAYLLTLAAACLGFGGSVFFSIIALSAAPLQWWRDEPAARVVLVQIVLTAAMIAYLIKPRRVLRLSTPAQRWVAAAAWLLVLALSVTVILLFDD